jgi:hypothetical protein
MSAAGAMTFVWLLFSQKRRASLHQALGGGQGLVEELLHLLILEYSGMVS